MTQARALTKFQSADPVTNRLQDHLSEVLGPVLANPVVNLRDYRFSEAPYPSDKDPICLVLQHRTPPDTWSTVFVVNPAGKIILGSIGSV